MSALGLRLYSEMQTPGSHVQCSFSVIYAGGFSEEDCLMCTRCLCWNLTAPFSQCNCNELTGCRRCLYIQKSPCKDVSVLTHYGPYSVANGRWYCRNFCLWFLSSDETSSLWLLSGLLAVMHFCLPAGINRRTCAGRQYALYSLSTSVRAAPVR
jgi:hypothetical protein